MQAKVQYVSRLAILWVASLMCLLSSCNLEFQQQVSRSIQNWTGTDGVLDIISDGQVIYRFIRIDKLSTPIPSEGGGQLSYRYGYGVLDKNQNYLQDDDEHKIYFEIGNYATSYVFYENPEQRLK